MIQKYVKGKVYVFIDASNIYHSQKELNWNIDFKKLKKYFEKYMDLGRIFYYTAYDPVHEKQRKFLDFLEIIGYTVKKKKVKFIKDGNKDKGGFHKGNLDVEITMDAIENRDNFQSFILFSGDSDFDALLKNLKAHGKNCIVVSIKNHVSIELIKQAKFVSIKHLKKEIKYEERH